MTCLGQTKAAQQSNKEIQMIFLMHCAADNYGPDGSLCVWSRPVTVMMKMVFFLSVLCAQSATLQNMLVHKNLPLCLAVH